MHHAFPLECPYPHELGATNPLTRSEWIQESGQVSAHATLKEMQEHIHSDACHVDAGGGVQCSEEDDPDLPWNDNEELVAHGPDPQTTALHRVGMLVMSLAVAGLVAFGAVAVKFIMHTRKRRVTNASPDDLLHNR